jgi:CheY-like chemotaxis protein
MEKTENKKLILVVDDNENLRNVLIEKFNMSGYKTVGAADGEEGLAKAFELHPDIILLDVLMPKIGGLEMLSKLREDKWGKEVKVIMLTVLDNIDAVAQAVGKGTFVYLVKTNHNLDDVVKQVENVLGDR